MTEQSLVPRFAAEESNGGPYPWRVRDRTGPRDRQYVTADLWRTLIGTRPWQQLPEHHRVNGQNQLVTTEWVRADVLAHLLNTHLDREYPDA